MLKQLIEEKIAAGEPVRLHLGCGSKLFDNYINVDGEYMSHHPDVIIQDISQPFPLPDGCVDEILTVHVVEHLYRPQLVAVLSEWRRILKDDGFVATEWPDILKISRYISDNPESLVSANPKIHKRTVLGIFGNMARYQDDVMQHKWAYSELSLAQAFMEAGFGYCRREQNHHPKTEIDSRVVAFKQRPLDVAPDLPNELKMPK